MAPFRDFNFFIGANNSGKSTVLNFISQNLPFKDKPLSVSGLDVYKGLATGQLSAQVGIDEKEFVDSCVSGIGDPSPDLVEMITRVISAISENGWIWLERSTSSTHSFGPSSKLDIASLKNTIDASHWHHLWNRLTGQTGGSILQHWIPETISAIFSRQSLKIPKAK